MTRRNSQPGLTPVVPDPAAAGLEPDPPRPPAAGPAAGSAAARAPRVLSLGRVKTSLPIWAATVLLFVISWGVEPQSMSRSALQGMLPFAGVLAIVAVGQTLVVQQGGIDLSVPGVISLTVIICTVIPNGDSGKLGVAIVLAFAAAAAAGLVSGFCVARIGITPIVTTLGMNALLYGFDLAISGGTPTNTTAALNSFATAKVVGIPVAVIIAVVVTVLVALAVKRTVIGRRFEAAGANPVAARAAGLRVERQQLGGYVAANLLYCAAGVLLAGIVTSPSAFQGDSYLLPSVAAVVLGGTSLLGGRGDVIATAVAALFLSQLDQVVLITGVNSAVQNLIEAAALAAGVAIYGIRWSRLRGLRPPPAGPRAAPHLSQEEGPTPSA
jgi:ribose transport system permease protein